MVSVDVKHNERREKKPTKNPQPVHSSRAVNVEVAVLDSLSLISPEFFCGRKATLNRTNPFRAQELCEGGGGRPGLHAPNSRYGLCGLKATMNPQSSGPV